MTKILRKIKSEKSRFLVVFFILALCIFSPMESVHAGWIEDVEGALGGLIFGALSALLQLTALPLVVYFVHFSAWVVDVFLDPNLYTTVLSSSVIDTGWRTVRDFCNMFYIFFLLLIAFATITRNQTYSAKSLLPKFILSLFLINFSMVIAKVAIDFGQVFLFGIAAWMGSFSSDTGAAAGLTSIVDYFKNQFAAQETTTMSSLFLLIFAICYSLMLGFLYLMLAGFLLVRLIMFVILIMVSPFAFFSIVLPSMRKHSSEWWDSLFKNVISGPVFVFFIFVSANLAYELMGNVSPALPPELNFAQRTMAIIIPQLIAVGMLWAAIPASQRIGAAGSKQLIGGTMGIGKIAMGSYAATKLVSKPVGWGGRKLVERSDTAAGISNKMSGAYQAGVSHVPFAGKGMALQSKANQEAKKQKAVDDRLKKYGGDLKAIDVNLAMKSGNRVDQAIGLKAAAAQGKLNDSKYEKQFKQSQTLLSKKDLGELTDKNLKFAALTADSQRRISNGEGFDTGATKRMNDNMTLRRVSIEKAREEEIMREKMMDLVADNKAGAVQNLSDKDVARIWTESQSRGQLTSSVKSLNKDKKNDLAKGASEAAKDITDAGKRIKLAAVALQAGAKVEEALPKGTLSDTDYNKQVQNLFDGFNVSDAADRDKEDLGKYGYMLSAEINKNIAKNATSEQVEAIRGSLTAASASAVSQTDKDAIGKKIKALEEST